MCRLFVGADPDLWKSETRSFRMDGMVTSVRLEHMFWNALEKIAAREELGIPQLLHRLYEESITEGHDLANFTSFLRVCCLRFANLQLKGLIPQQPGEEMDGLSAEEILSLEAKNARKPKTSGGIQRQIHRASAER